MGSVAVIGAGYWGPNLVRNFMSLGAFDQVIACDIDRERLNSVCQRFPGLEGCADPDRLFKIPEVEAVVIATPVRLHYPMAKAALEAGKHVLIEKPMTQNSKQARELIDLAESRKLTLMVDHTFIFTSVVEKIAEIVRSGDFGDFYYVDSVRINLGLFQHDVNVIWDLAPHDLSIVNHILGEKPRVVRATGLAHTKTGLVDVAYLNVEYGNNVAANFHINWLSPTKVRRMIFGGSNRMIVWNDLEQAEKLRVYDKGIEVSEADRNKQYDLQIGYRMGDAWLPQLNATEALKKMASHFVDCCRDSKTPITGGQNGLDVVLALEASEMSLANDGKPVAIEGEKFTLI